MYVCGCSVHLLHDWNHRNNDGLSALGNSTMYHVLSVTNNPLYTNITVDLGPAPQAYHQENIWSRLLSYLMLLTVSL